ncbi:MAG: SipW-dependent-type signal peptide-containing protein [Clostridia bacterium]|nr:SipW-dependent-type signal peptide-containing protein [Clostridia bacterium]
MAKRRSTAIILALIAIILSATLITASTFALFSDQVRIQNHLQAGNLKITLARTAYSYSILDEDGYLKTTGKTGRRDLIGDITNVFELPDDALIVPTSELSATFDIENNDDVAFVYTVQLLVFDEEHNEIAAEDYENYHLLDQLELKLEGNGQTITEKLSADKDRDFIIEGTTITVDQKDSFTVKLSFLNLEDDENNKAQNDNVYFDIVIHAVQSTTRPTENP